MLGQSLEFGSRPSLTDWFDGYLTKATRHDQEENPGDNEKDKTLDKGKGKAVDKGKGKAKDNGKGKKQPYLDMGNGSAYPPSLDIPGLDWPPMSGGLLAHLRAISGYRPNDSFSVSGDPSGSRLSCPGVASGSGSRHEV